MGGAVEGGFGFVNRSSPRRAAIEKVQAELRQEYDVLEERRRQLEFLEKGGDPLEFKFGSAASVSVQSTSVTGQHPDEFVTSKAKGSFVHSASPHGDSVESSGRLGAPPICEPNSADNLMLFDGENEFPVIDGNYTHSSKSCFVPSIYSSQFVVNENAKELKDSSAFSLPRKAYKRRSRPIRNGAGTGSIDAGVAHGCDGAPLSSDHAAKEVNSDIKIQKDQNVTTNCDSTPASPRRGTTCKSLQFDDQLGLEFVEAESTADLIKVPPAGASDANVSKYFPDVHDNQHTIFTARTRTTELISEEHALGKQDIDSADLECKPCVPTTQVEDQVNGVPETKGDGRNLDIEGQNIRAAVGTKVLDSESSCSQTFLSLNGTNDIEKCIDLKTIDSNGNAAEQTLVPKDRSVEEEAAEVVKEKKRTAPDDGMTLKDESYTIHQNCQVNGLPSVPEEELKRGAPVVENPPKHQIVVEKGEADGATGSEAEMKDDLPLKVDPVTRNETASNVSYQGSIGSSIQELPKLTPSVGDSTAAKEGQENNVKVLNKSDEDAIFEEARIIEAKHKRIAELSVATFSKETRPKSHWDYVLEEMAWLANDFAQERLWKTTAAAQLCHRVAFSSQLRYQEQHCHKERKRVAHVLSKAVMDFWSSVQETSKGIELKCQKDSIPTIREYAVRFLKFNSSHFLHIQAEAPVTPDRISDLGILDVSLEDHRIEENLFYTVPYGAMEAYCRIIESHMVQSETIGGSLQEEVETSACDVVTDFGSQENAYVEEGEASAYDFDFSKPSRFSHKKRKTLTKRYGVRSYEVGADILYTQCMENKAGNNQSVLIGKRPASNLNVSIPTKRVRTASRLRVLSPFTARSGCVRLPSKADASSGDTGSFQDDQSTLNGGSVLPTNLGVESMGDFEKQLPFDSSEVSKPKKKKKSKHLISAYEQRRQVDSNFYSEQMDHSTKRSENHQLEAYGSSGLFGQHVSKKTKVMRQALDSSFDNIAPVAGSVPSPVASQMSNMSNPNKLIKILGGGDRGRKAKASKPPPGQQGSDSPWSLFEDQALVVLVHDMGPNWELVSDAINSTLQFKCIHRKPKECKERHKILMDTNGDGADSAEDSGSSQPYPSTLPGIPKGSARQLFQRLQGPLEEDTVKSHFEKIIVITQENHNWKTQNNKHNPKQLQQPHSSHMLALSQLSPNNLNGGRILTPLDLCDVSTSSPDILSLGYQSPHASGVAMSNQVSISPILPASGINAALQGSASMVVGNSSGAVNAHIRDGRYAVPRSASLSIDEQQKMQQYNQTFTGRNIQQPALTAPGGISGTDRGVRMLPSSVSTGVMGGIKRIGPVVRPGFQAMASASMLNSGSMLSSGMAMQSPANTNSGPGPGQGNSVVMRPREALQTMQPSQNQETQRQMMAPELQMQASQASSQGVTPYGGLSSSFPNQKVSPPVSSYSLQHQQSTQQPHVLSPRHPHIQGANRPSSAQQQAYAIRLAKERHLQQRILQRQQQQQLATSNALSPHVQSQSQLPKPSPLPSTSQQTSSPPGSFSPLSASSMSQQQQKPQVPPHGLVRNSQTASGCSTNQVGKQRRHPQQQQQQQQPQLQQLQQSGRQHPQQRQQTQSQQQTKHLKGVGNMVIQQNTSINPSLNGVPANPGNQSIDRGEQAMHLVEGQGLYSGSATNSVQSSKQLVSPNSSNQSQTQQKIYPNQVAPTSKHVQQKTSHSDHNCQENVAPAASACHQSVPSSIAASSIHQHPPQHPQLPVHSHKKLVYQKPPTFQRVAQQNLQVNSEQANKLEPTESQIEKHLVSNTSHASVSMPQAGNDASDGTRVVLPSSVQGNASEPLYDSVTSAPGTNLASTQSPPTNAAGKPIDGLDQKQTSRILSTEHEDNSQRQQHSQPRKSPLPVSQPQQNRQLAPAQNSQQQVPNVESGTNSQYVPSGDSSLE